MNISISEDIQPISIVKANLSTMLKRTKKTKRPIIITQNGRAAGVLLNTDEWEHLNNQIVSKLIAEAETSIDRDKKIQTFDKLDKKLRNKYGI